MRTPASASSCAGSISPGTKPLTPNGYWLVNAIKLDCFALSSCLLGFSVRELPLDEACERAGFGAGLSPGRKERP